jgi:serine/threonine-protein kinase
MPTDVIRSFSETLRQGPLLSEAQRQEFVRELAPRFSDAKLLAKQLLDRGWLTSFQVNQIFLGKGGDLVLGPYVLLERLGEGGTGQVYKARHTHMNRIVALKLIRHDLLADKEVLARFQREIQLVSTLTNPHVVHAYDAGPSGQNYYLVMEYVEGMDLARLVKQHRQLPVVQACDYIRQAALGLQHIHERGLVHRDIKPSNLFITNLPGNKRSQTSDESPWGTLKILDLGLARLQRPIHSEVTGDLTNGTSMALGTLDYMAPEQALDFHSADIRADIYSLGCSFHQLLTAQPPFVVGTVAQKLLRHQQQEAPPVDRFRSDVPAPIVAVLRRMMAKQPKDRYQTPIEVARLLLALTPAPEATYLPTVLNTDTTARLPMAVPVAAPGAMVVVDARPAPVVRVVLQRALREVPTLVRRRPRLALAGAAVMCASFFLFVGLIYLAFRGSGEGSRTVAVATRENEKKTQEVTKDQPKEKEEPPVKEGETVFLSDLQEFNVQARAFAKDGFLGHNGNNNLGGDWKTFRIIVNGTLARKGLSTYPPSGGAAQVSYRLGKRYNHFKTGVGLHGRGWFSGSVVTFTVFGDGAVLWQSKPIRDYSEPPQECNVKVTGVNVIELQVTCTGESNGVWPVWIDPAVRK